jgi:hypothetical protein
VRLICEIYFGLESGGQSGRASIGLPPLCTVGAAEFEPPASGRTALFSTATEFDVLALPLPDVAAEDVVQLGARKGSTIHFATASAHIAAHFTIAGSESLTVHAKWIGRSDQRGA